MDYGILSVIPPLLTIILAFVIKDVLIALFAGVLARGDYRRRPELSRHYLRLFCNLHIGKWHPAGFNVFYGPHDGLHTKSRGLSSVLQVGSYKSQE